MWQLMHAGIFHTVKWFTPWHTAVALNIHSQIPCFRCSWLRASSWNLKQTPLCPTPLVADKGRVSCSQGRGGRGAQEAGAADRDPPTTDSWGKEDRSAGRQWQWGLFPGQPHRLVPRKNLRNLPLYRTPASCPLFPAWGWHIAPHKVLIQILKMESPSLEDAEAPAYHYVRALEGTERRDLTVSLLCDICPFYVPFFSIHLSFPLTWQA